MHGLITTWTTPLTWYACTRHGRSGPGRCELCADERAVAANIAYLGERIDAQGSALNNMSRRIDLTSDQADRADTALTELESRLADLELAHNRLVGYAERQDARIGELKDQLGIVLRILLAYQHGAP